MNSSRRDFLRFFAMSAAMAAATGAGLPTLALAADDNKPDKWVKGVCRYCGTGCGVLVGVKNGKAVAIQGDPNNHNAGLLCLKGSLLIPVLNSKERVTQPMNLFVPPLRPPGAADEESFLRKCVRCGKCVTACPYESIELAGGFGRTRRTPQVRPRRKPCYLCMKCPPVCPTGALDNSVVEMHRAGMASQEFLRKRVGALVGGVSVMPLTTQFF